MFLEGATIVYIRGTLKSLRTRIRRKYRYMEELNKSLNLTDWAEIIIETDEESPRTIMKITPEDPDTLFDIIDSNIRVRLIPKHD